MIQARIRKTFPPRKDSSAFSLDVDFRAASGVTVLFGPSGSGKTMVLDSIAGFVRPDEGRILVEDAILYDGEAKVHLSPQARNCGYVFQNYALFPHMTLRENLAFAAERRPRLERHRRVNETIERFRLGEVAGRRPQELSGGQRQLFYRPGFDWGSESASARRARARVGRASEGGVLRNAASSARGFPDAYSAGDARS